MQRTIQAAIGDNNKLKEQIEQLEIKIKTLQEERTILIRIENEKIQKKSNNNNSNNNNNANNNNNNNNNNNATTNNNLNNAGANNNT